MDGRAGQSCSWVLHTCCGSELCSVNRAPRSADCSLSHSLILMLGDDDLTTLDQQLFIFRCYHFSIFILISQFIRFHLFFNLTFILLIVIGARVCTQSHVSSFPKASLYKRCPPTSRMEQLVKIFFFPLSHSSQKCSRQRLKPLQDDITHCCDSHVKFLIPVVTSQYCPLATVLLHGSTNP